MLASFSAPKSPKPEIVKVSGWEAVMKPESVKGHIADIQIRCEPECEKFSEVGEIPDIKYVVSSLYVN